MPIFDFQCQDCGGKFDLMIRNKEKEEATCPSCHSRNIKQLLSGFNTGSGSGSSKVPAPDCSQGCPMAGGGG
ncbi:MAG TPA: zinc ribbon domain-containing protein [Syntrophomonadaceae bacterium]|nr:zinc ribbon domain-containing protein [Syntrophomonadaceae bacterium]